MSNITVPENEYGKLRVFSLSMPDEAAQALRDNVDPFSQAHALGVEPLDAAHIEVFRVSDLGEIGLYGYLREGVDVEEASLTRDAAKLAAVDGWVMLVHSPAFGGREVSMNTRPELTLIGTYALAQADSTTISLESEAAAPYTGVPGTTPPIAPKGRAGGSLMVVGLAVFAALILWWAFS